MDIIYIHGINGRKIVGVEFQDFLFQILVSFPGGLEQNPKFRLILYFIFPGVETLNL